MEIYHSHAQTIVNKDSIITIYQFEATRLRSFACSNIQMK